MTKTAPVWQLRTKAWNLGILYFNIYAESKNARRHVIFLQDTAKKDILNGRQSLPLRPFLTTSLALTVEKYFRSPIILKRVCQLPHFDILVKNWMYFSSWNLRRKKSQNWANCGSLLTFDLEIDLEIDFKQKSNDQNQIYGVFCLVNLRYWYIMLNYKIPKFYHQFSHWCNISPPE